MTRLRAIDRAADARARLYAQELRLLIQIARETGAWSVPVSALESLADRMDGNEPHSENVECLLPDRGGRERLRRVK